MPAPWAEPALKLLFVSFSQQQKNNNNKTETKEISEKKNYCVISEIEIKR